MARIHLFEWEDFGWFPGFLRDRMTEYLAFITTKFDGFKPAAPILQKALKDSGGWEVIDLCSGGGGSIERIYDYLKETEPAVEIMLTDLYPNMTLAAKLNAVPGGKIRYREFPVDATNVPEGTRGMRTMFLGLHHFRPDDAVKILRDAAEDKQVIVILEGQERGIKSILTMLFSPLMVLVLTPFIRPFKIDRIIFTYLIPILPLLIMWDGVVSALRTYSLKEMEELTKKVNVNGYKWEMGKTASVPPGVIWLVGKAE